jgi:hypothetical protein
MKKVKPFYAEVNIEKFIVTYKTLDEKPQINPAEARKARILALSMPPSPSNKDDSQTTSARKKP